MTGATEHGDGDIGTATAAEIDWLIELAAEEGWNPGLEDAAAFRAADPEGFLVVRVDGRAVAGISVVRQDAASGFLGLYLCAPEWRGRGHGRRVWRAGLARLEGRRIGLDGVAAQEANYAREGFRAAWRNHRYAGPVPADEGDGGDGDGASRGVADGTTDGGGPRPVTPADLPALVALDRDVGGVERSAFLGAWLAPTATRRSLWYADAAGRAVAVGTIRRCREDFKLGPLIAPSPALARRLLLDLARDGGADRVVLDVPDGNAAGVALAVELGLAPVFETARMYRGAAPAVDPGRLFGVATLELG